MEREGGNILLWFQCHVGRGRKWSECSCFQLTVSGQSVGGQWGASLRLTYCSSLEGEQITAVSPTHQNYINSTVCLALIVF